MLLLKTLSAKSFFDKAGKLITDLTRRSMSFLGVDSLTGEIYVVEKEVEMRPDLIAHAFLQDSSYACLLMKYNSISNPFSIHEGQVLRVPTADVLESMVTQASEITANRIREERDIVQPKTKQDKTRLDYLKNKGSLAVPPNVALDEGVKVVNGRIIFGADVTSVKKEDCAEPISRARLKETLLKNKIFG